MTTSASRKVTVQQIIGFMPCGLHGDDNEEGYTPQRIQRLFDAAELTEASAADILRIGPELGLATEDLFWLVLRPELLDESIMRCFGLLCAEHVEHLNEQACQCNVVSRRFLAGEATLDELKAAASAADAVRAAASAASTAASDADAASAAWAAARVASTAASAANAARAASTAVSDADAASAAWAAARAASTAASAANAARVASTAASAAWAASAACAAWAARVAEMEWQRQELLRLLKNE